MTKESYLQVKMHTAVSEGKGMDLIAMGRGEGPGCYCYPNLMLRGFVEDLSANYPYVIIDNEAGMEHLSRRTSEKIDHMILVSDPSIRGLRSARRIHALIEELNLDVSKISLVVSRAPDPLPAPLEEELQACGIPLLGKVPADKTIEQYDLALRPLTELPDSSPAVKASRRILEALNLN
jgi:CO dehydrogenase maturation factor